MYAYVESEKDWPGNSKALFQRHLPLYSSDLRVYPITFPKKIWNCLLN